MMIKVGSIVSHSGVVEWGVGRVLEVSSAMVTIHFSDGKSRKIAASHFSSLTPASPGSYIPPSEAAPKENEPKIPKTPRKKKVTPV